MKEDIGRLVLRLWTGGSLALAHGWGKLTGFSEMSSQFPDILGVGSSVNLALVVFAELFCALAVCLGFKTKWATIPIMITMLVAAFVAHADDPFGKKELALSYFVAALTIALIGPGRYSLDRVLKLEK